MAHYNRETSPFLFLRLSNLNTNYNCCISGKLCAFILHLFSNCLQCFHGFTDSEESSGVVRSIILYNF